MPDSKPTDAQPLIARALARDARAVQQLVAALTPKLRLQVERVLRRGARGRDVRFAADDVVQSVWLALFAHQGKVLRSWDPARGMSLESFVGLVATRHALDVVRSRRLNPYSEDPIEHEQIELRTHAAPALDDQLATRQLFHEIAERLRTSLTPYGMQMFELLFVEGKSVEQVSDELTMCSDAVYGWRSRLTQRVRELAREILSETPADARSKRSKPAHGR
jgi:RNA polymerase sigma-70 factor (ECF subfamily)